MVSETDAEPVPTGLAQALLDAVGTLQYDGAIELMEEECSGVAAPGALLNLTGGRAEWATMAAQVQRTQEAIDLGLTKITVGPGKHLGHGDLAELLRVNSQRRPSYRLPDPDSTTALGTFTFFGTDVPVFCTALAPPRGPDAGETRTFSGALTVAGEWA